eukprot:548382-Pyramimonas_sp.AAC.1
MEADLLGLHRAAPGGPHLYVGRGAEPRSAENDALLTGGGPHPRGCPVSARWRRIAAVIWETLACRRRLREMAATPMAPEQLRALRAKAGSLAAGDLGGDLMSEEE